MAPLVVRVVAAQLRAAGAAEQGGGALGGEGIRQGLGDVQRPGSGPGQPEIMPVSSCLTRASPSAV